MAIWMDLLVSLEKAGGDIKPTERTAMYYAEMFANYVTGHLPGVALLAVNERGVLVGVLMWGGLPEAPFDRSDERVVIGWGAYTVPDMRRRGISQALREGAILTLAERGIHTVQGSAMLANTPGIESSRKIQFQPTSLLGELNLHDEAQKIKLRRSGLADADLTDGFYWQGHCPLCGNDPQEEAT